MRSCYEYLLEPVKMIGEGEYNMNDLTDIRSTDSYLGLDKEVTECQIEEPLFDCTTRKYVETYLDQCKCLPLNIRRSRKVCQAKETVI